MPPFEAKRAVEVRLNDGRSASGYQIADKLVLTAAHLFINGGSVTEECVIRCHRDNKNYINNIKKEGQAKLKAKMIWYLYKNNIDVALVEVVDPDYVPEHLQPVSFACTKEMVWDEDAKFKMFTYPCYKKYQDKEKRWIQGGGKIEGSIQWVDIQDTSGMTNDTLILSSDSPPKDLPHTCKDSPWTGASGAPIFYKDKCIGILKADINSEINATKLSYVLKNKEFWAILVSFGYRDHNYELDIKPSRDAFNDLEKKLLVELKNKNSRDVLGAIQAQILKIDTKIKLESVEQTVKYLLKILEDKSVLHLIDKVIKTSIDEYEQMTPSKDVQSSYNSYKSIIELFLPFAFEDYLDKFRTVLISNQYPILKLAVTSKFGVEIFSARMKNGKVSFTIDELGSVNVEHTFQINDGNYVTENKFDLNKLLIEIWGLIFFDKKRENEDNSITFNDKLDMVRALKYEKLDENRIYYGALELAEDKNNDSLERFREISEQLFAAFEHEDLKEFIDYFAMISYGVDEWLKVRGLEKDLVWSIIYFMKKLNKIFLKET